MKKRGILIGILLTVLLVVPACASKNSSKSDMDLNYDSGTRTETTSDAGGSGLYGNAAAGEKDSAEAPAAQEAGTESKSTAENSDTARKLIRNVTLELETLEFEDSLALITEEMNKAGGYVESSSVSGNSSESRGSRNARFVLRVPVGKADSFISVMGSSMNLVHKREESEDITLKYVDTESRVKALTIEQERLLALLEKTEKIEDIIALEDRLSTVRYQLEQNASTIRTYDNLVDYATITISLDEVLRISPPEEKGIGSRMSTGLKNTLLTIRDGFLDFLVWFVVNLPYILFWGLVIGISLLVFWKKVYRKEKQSAAQAPKKERPEEKE